MMRHLLTALLLCAAGAAQAADPPKDPNPFAGGGGKVPSTYDLSPAVHPKRAAAVIDESDILVERYRNVPLAKPPEPEQRDVFEGGGSVNAGVLDERLATTRSGYRDGCNAGEVCYGSAPRLRDSFSNLFGN